MKRIIQGVALNSVFVALLYAGLNGSAGAGYVLTTFAVIFGLCCFGCFALPEESGLQKLIEEHAYNKTYAIIDYTYDILFFGALIWNAWFVTAFFYFFIAVLSSHINTKRKEIANA